jgi:putative ubiquitin-RnfH superfamily antitoxin RatB of RatAB toxin-antitoxin module
MSESFPIILYFSINDYLMNKTFNIPPDTSIKIFIEKFNIESILPHEDIEIGVYGKIMREDYIIKIDDRLELYVKVKMDPKTRRKKLAKI